MTEALELVRELSTVGFPTLLLLILYGSYKGVWVWGRQLQEKSLECEQWKTAFLRTSAHTDKAIDLAAKTVVGG